MWKTFDISDSIADRTALIRWKKAPRMQFFGKDFAGNEKNPQAS
jgi:hypothetical protein